MDLAPLPGTIIRVTDPPATGDGIPFGGAGLVNQDTLALPAWTFQGTINSQVLQPGETLRAVGMLRIVSAVLQEACAMQVRTRLSIERLSGPDGLGTLAQNNFASALLTPTGLPIERSPSFVGGDAALIKLAFMDLIKVGGIKQKLS